MWFQRTSLELQGTGEIPRAHSAVATTRDRSRAPVLTAQEREMLQQLPQVVTDPRGRGRQGKDQLGPLRDLPIAAVSSSDFQAG